MANEDDICKLAAENVQLRADWLKDANEIATAIPYVQKAMQWDVLCVEAFRTKPTGQSLPNTERLQNLLVLENTYLKGNQPKLPQAIMTCAVTGSGVAYSVGTEAASLFLSCEQNGTTEVKVWATEQLSQFIEPLQEDTYIALICSKLDRLYPGSTKEFQDAMQTTRAVIAGASIDSSAGIAMRNVLESFNGNMRELGRKRSGNKNLSKWGDVARSVAKGGPTSFEANQLAAKEKDWKQLHDDTTKVAKNDAKLTPADLEAAYFRWLGLLHSALSFIELCDGS